MTVFRVPFFSGKISKVSPRLIPDDVAQVATNVKFESGQARAWKTNLSTGTTLTGVIQTIFRYSSSVWLQFNADVDVVRSPIAEDPHDRVYFSGLTYPRMTNNAGATSGPPYPGVYYRLGLPRPTKPTPAITGTATAGTTPSSIAYVLTLVTGFGEESPPSVVTTSDIVTWSLGQTRTITIPAFPTGDYYTTGRKYRLYRTNATGTFQFHSEIAAPGTVTDVLTDDQLGEVAPSENWIAPPDEVTADHPDGGLKGLVALPNGILAGFTGNTVCFSEPYLPHAWPKDYQVTVSSDVVGLASISAGLLVATKGKPVLIQGTSPASMAVTEVDANFPCVSKRSIVDMGDYAIYASPVGLVIASADGIKVATQEVLTREQWQAYNPSTIHAYQYDGRYIAFNATTGFVFDPRGEKNMWADLGFTATAGFYDRTEDALYLLISGVLHKFDSGTAQPYTWKSKEFFFQRPFCPAAARVDASTYPVTLKLLADGALKHTQTVADNRSFALPSGYLANAFTVELTGTADVNFISVADNRGEL